MAYCQSAMAASSRAEGMGLDGRMQGTYSESSVSPSLADIRANLSSSRSSRLTDRPLSDLQDKFARSQTLSDIRESLGTPHRPLHPSSTMHAPLHR